MTRRTWLNRGFQAAASLLLLRGAQAAPTTAVVSPLVVTVDGKTLRPLDNTRSRAVVLLFVGRECPISNRYAPEVIRICHNYAAKGVAFYVVYAEPGLPSIVARKHALDFGFPCPALLDGKQQLAKLAGATVTPEVAVFTGGKRRYLGRIDDWYAALGQARPAATTHDLCDTLNALLAGKPVPHPQTRAIGCYLPEP